MIYLFLANGFEEVEALAPLDLLRRAGQAVTTVAVGGERTVTGSHGISVVADMTDTQLADTKDISIDMVILPGGMPGATNLDASPVVDAMLSLAAEQNAYLCAICAAPLVLGRRGLLEGKSATCYPGFEHELMGAVSVGGQVIRDGNIITAQGMGAALPFGLELVSVMTSEAVAGQIKDAIKA